MKTKFRPLILLVALICGLPLSLMALYGLPWMIAASVAMLRSAPSINAVFGCGFALATIFSLVTYWRLAISTALRRKFVFGYLFWLAVACAAGVAYEFSKWFGGPEPFLLLVLPMAGSAVYFSIQQRTTGGLAA